MENPTSQTSDRDVADTRALHERALAHQRAGRLRDAERAYEHVLQRRPNHFDALQTQRPERAVELIAKALPQKPTLAAAHNHLTKALLDLG